VTGPQKDAFSVSASGFTPDNLSDLIIGLLVAICLLWAAWTLISFFRQFAEKKMEEGDFVVGIFRVIFVLFMVTLFVQ